MSKDDRAALLRAWTSWSTGRAMNNQTCLDFVDEVVRRDRRFSGIHVFEVLDLVVNAEPARRSA